MKEEREVGGRGAGGWSKRSGWLVKEERVVGGRGAGRENQETTIILALRGAGR